MTHSVPSLFEELNRKTVDAMVWLHEGGSCGSLSQGEVYVAHQALFTAVAGLLSPDVNDLLSASGTDSGGMRQHVYRKGDRIVILTLTPNGDVFVDHAVSTVASHNETPAASYKDFDKSQQAYQRIRDKFLSNGYTPLTRSDQ